ncbi:unnamed protein product [Euphydryas editha]|uniref:Uncharacterized protein n=1 Tax=Euphydryas editha TaxID=104508 RepID=A0AAU9TZX9_EUPED|nr:unnamed protein product [Euphydryas editha]
MLNEITVAIVPRSKVAASLLRQNKRHVDARTRQKFDIVRPRMHTAAIFRGWESAGAAATSGVGLPGPATDHQNNFSSWQYLATWQVPAAAYLSLCVSVTNSSAFFFIFCINIFALI